MTVVVAVLALMVAAIYAVIAFEVIPAFARRANVRGRWAWAAQVGVMLFFAGCALTHLGLVWELLAAHGPSSQVADPMPLMPGMGQQPALTPGWRMLVEHVVPHVAQIAGGLLVIWYSHRRLELTVMTKSDAQRLRETALQFRIAFERAPVGVALLSFHPDTRGQILQANPAFHALLGYEMVDLQGRMYGEFLATADRDVSLAAVAALESGQPAAEVEQHLVHRAGHEISARVQGSLVRGEDGSPLLCVAHLRDITEDVRRESRVRYLADHDSLTGLFNRRRFEEELDRVLAHTHRYAQPAALLVIDLDHFKFVNDTYGHSVGDALLVAVAQALRSRIRSTDILGRLGGDEFGVLCTQTGLEDVAQLGRALVATIHDEAHTTTGGRQVRVEASVGIKMIDGQVAPVGEKLLAEADVAMYEAKETGRERVCVMDDHTTGLARMRSRLAWSESIREALATDGFQLWEQPILNLVTGACDRSEILLRMIDPRTGEIILPGQFLSVAERFGQIQAIDRWVFSHAIALLAHRQANGDTRALEINLSGVSITDSELMDDLTWRIMEAPIDPTRLIVEITETSAIGNFELARQVAARLTDLGCNFSLDDFGSGFGSFFYLKHLPFQGIKIDGEFIKELPRNPTDRLTVEAIVTIAQGMGKDTTAEFVEDEQTLDLLRTLGVDYAQGYHVGRPRPVPDPYPRPTTSPRPLSAASPEN